MRPCKNFTYFTLIKILLNKLFKTWTFDSYLTVIQNRLTEKYIKIQNIKHDVRHTVLKLAWQKGCRMRSRQEIKCFWRTLSCLNIIVTRWKFGAWKEILSFAFLLFLWDNASQKLRIPPHFVNCELLIRILPYLIYATSYFKVVKNI